ncbi:MAG: NAD(P)/FAD-dependent oxidoreductase [Betaproteobacteria bacterium]
MITEATTAAPHRIVIVGGGAGGLPLATSLGDRYGRKGAVQVTLVDRHATHVWKPLLHEVAAGRMDADAHDLDYLAIAHWHGFKFRQGALCGIDRAHKEITLDVVRTPEGEEILPQRKLAYDTLVICIGSVSNDFGVPGVAQHAVSLDALADAERFHRRLLAVCVRADGRAGTGVPALVHIVIIGAGATGVELAAELRQTTRAHAGYGLDQLDPAQDIKITLLEASSRILPPLSEHVATAATELLRRLDVDVRTGERVTAVDDKGVSTAAGDFYPGDLVVWAAGIMAPEILTRLDGLETNRANQLVVGPTLQTTIDTEIMAFGDCAAAPWLGHPGVLLPPRAQVAHQQATLLAKSIAARLKGKPPLEFRFHDFGSLVSLGELSAVGNLMGRLIGGSLLIQGLIARVMYASLYKMHQVSIHGFVRVAFDTLGRILRERLEPRVKLH